MKFDFVKNKINLDPIIQEILSLVPGTYLSGGAVRDIHLGLKPKDYDLYFKDKESYNTVLNYLIGSGAKAIDSKWVTITFDYKGFIFQLIHKNYFEKPEDVYADFDFINVMGTLYWDSNSCFGEELKLVCHEEFKKVNEEKIVKINVITNCFKSFERLIPYMKKVFDVDEAYDYMISLFQERKDEKRVLMLQSYY